MSRGVIVLGMHRSGTSLVAEMLHRGGVFGRVQECLPSDRWNARGYWELVPLVEFNESLLRAVGASWSFPPSDNQDLFLSELAQQSSYRTQALNLLGSMQVPAHNDWFWKDPRLSLLLPFWREIWGEPRYVICVRDPIEICRSLLSRDKLSFSVSLTLWQRYMLSILRGTQNTSALFVSYDRMLQQPRQECERLSNFLRSSEVGSDVASLANTSAMRSAVDTHLRHCKANYEDSPVSLTGRQLALQKTLESQAASDENANLDLSQHTAPSAWRTLLRLHLLLMRVERRCKCIFPHPPLSSEPLSEKRLLAFHYAMGLELLELRSQFTSHSGFLQNALMSSSQRDDTEGGRCGS